MNKFLIGQQTSEEKTIEISLTDAAAGRRCRTPPHDNSLRPLAGKLKTEEESDEESVSFWNHHFNIQ